SRQGASSQPKRLLGVVGADIDVGREGAALFPRPQGRRTLLAPRRRRRPVTAWRPEFGPIDAVDGLNGVETRIPKQRLVKRHRQTSQAAEPTMTPRRSQG